MTFALDRLAVFYVSLKSNSFGRSVNPRVLYAA